MTLRRRPDTRYQDPATQVVVKKKDRLKVIKMEAEE
jgi:NADH-quinone oxidoreductase subunit J